MAFFEKWLRSSRKPAVADDSRLAVRIEARAPVNKAEWAAAVRDALRSLAPDASITLDLAAFELVFERHDLVGVVRLANYWAEATRDRAAPEATAAKLHRAHLAIGSEREIEILPLLRERVTIEVEGNLRSRLDPKLESEDSIPYTTIGELLALAIVEDKAETIQYISTKQLQDEHHTFETELARATTSLLARRPPTQTTLRPGAYLFSGDEYGATHFLLGNLDRGLAVQGTPTAIFVSREHVLLIGSDDPPAIDAALEKLAELRQQPRAWVPRALQRGAAGWERPTTVRFARFAKKSLVFDYQKQTNLWRALVIHDGPRDEDQFVSEITGVEGPNGEIVTYATLSESVDTLLAETDAVALTVFVGDKPESLGLVRFSDFHAVMANRMKKLAVWPVRYRIAAFPTKAEIEKLAPSRRITDFAE